MKSLERPILICAGLLLAVSVVAFTPTYNFVIDLLSHFRFQYFCAAALGALICFTLMHKGLRTKPAVGFFLVAMGVNGWELSPYVPIGDTHPNINSSFKIALSNVRASNHNHKAVLSLVRNQSADLVVLIETNQRWVQAMGALKETYPYSVEIFRPNNFGMMILSKVSMEAIETRYFVKGEEIPSLIFEISIRSKKYRILAAHATPPLGANIYGQDFDNDEDDSATQIRERTLQLRNDHLRAITDWILAKSGPTLLVADLNTTPYSHAFKQFLFTSKLKDTRKGQGFLPTWGPIELFPFRIPIDHILVSEDLEATSLSVGPDIGSDHRPLIAVIRPRASSLSNK